ncbi:hypothetical protein ACOKFD_05000 [Flagellimonas sp. S174]|uniref:hypothetical protein n=1 Tax=Flagellimonas sp. S174 TaxID=3410790 RepID=UPI003BF5CF1B
MSDFFLQKAYEYYPRNLNFLNNSREIDQAYFETKEYKYLNEHLDRFCLDENHFLKSSSKGILDILQGKLELRDVSRPCQDDRAICLQHSGFYEEKTKKFRPLCFAISALIPYFHAYMMEIDLIEDNYNKPFKYQWKSISGPLTCWKEKSLYNDTYSLVCDTIIQFTDYKEFPEELVNKKIPDISKNNIEFGEVTFFNAFFLDRYYCYP